MQELVNGFFALSDQQKEYFILAIAPALCRVFQKNPDSIPHFCNLISEGEDGVMLEKKIHETLEKSSNGGQHGKIK
ncbi:MAG: hypothetical protein PHN80_16240 [Hespellia sp.]|nr:hypothetical protein [Hespellia sp.]